MANYTTNVSDKSKKKALTLLFIGGFGFHLFYVGRIKAGIVRFIAALMFWGGLIIGGISSGESEMVIVGFVALVLFNVFDLVKLLLGTFQDNIGNYLRA